MTRNAAKGFTLVELMTVVAIIAMLVAILLPTLRRGVELSRRTSCRSNCREIARACTLYGMDAGLQRGSEFPRTLPTVGPTSASWHTGDKANRESMRLLVTHEFLSPEMMVCPSVEGDDFDTFSDLPGVDDPLDGGRCGYSFLSMVRGALTADKLSASMVLVADRNPRFGPNSKTLLGGVPDHANSNIHHDADGEGEGQNIARLDESAAWITTTKVNTGASADDYIYESDSPGSDSSGRAGGLTDALLLN